MLLNHCSPNDATFHYLVNGLTNSMPCIINLTSHSTVKVHNRSALLDAFKGMVSDGLDPRISALNSIIFSLCRPMFYSRLVEPSRHGTDKATSRD